MIFVLVVKNLTFEVYWFGSNQQTWNWIAFCSTCKAQFKSRRLLYLFLPHGVEKRVHFEKVFRNPQITMNRKDFFLAVLLDESLFKKTKKSRI